MSADTIQKPWRITWGDVSFTGEELIGSDLMDLQLLVGEGWQSIDPWSSPLHLMSAIAVGVARLGERALDDVLAEIKSARAVDLLGALSSS